MDLLTIRVGFYSYLGLVGYEIGGDGHFGGKYNEIELSVCDILLFWILVRSTVPMKSLK